MWGWRARDIGCLHEPVTVCGRVRPELLEGEEETGGRGGGGAGGENHVVQHVGPTPVGQRRRAWVTEILCLVILQRVGL